MGWGDVQFGILDFGFERTNCLRAFAVISQRMEEERKVGELRGVGITV